MNKILEAKRELEYIALLNFQLNTREGFAHMFVAIDAFTGRAFNLNTELNESPESVLKSIYLLTEKEEFKKLNTRGFTLVLEDYESLAERIEAMIHPQNGKVIYNKVFNNFIANPFLKAMADYMK